MIRTRLQARREQSSLPVASLGADTPQFTGDMPPQGHPARGGADVSGATAGPGGDPANVACEVRTRNVIQRRCGRRRCAICDIFKEENKVICSVTKRTHHVINERGGVINCATENVVYLIQCNNCDIQYVGETSQPLSERMSDHKSRIRNYTEDKKDTFLIRHFNQGKCANHTFSVRILETIKEEARCDKKLDPVVTAIRRKREDYWMEQLHSIYPYGLNNRHGKNFDQADIDDPVRRVFKRQKIKKNQGSHTYVL